MNIKTLYSPTIGITLKVIYVIINKPIILKPLYQKLMVLVQ